MTSKRLTPDEIRLLQRYFDGECTADEQQAARGLIDRSAPAQVYVSALESMQQAVRLAEQQAWDDAQLMSPDELTQWAAEAAEDCDKQPLDELAPLLERFYDGEVDDCEAAFVAELVDRRDDVADYLGQLEHIGDGIRQAAPRDDVDFDGFWEGIEAGIDELETADQELTTNPVAVEPFDRKSHHHLLERYHDEEATADQRRQVEAWLESGDREVHAIMEALDAVAVGVEGALQSAQDELGQDEIADGIAERLDAIDARRRADNVVAFDEAQSADKETATNWRKPVVAAVAALALLATGALLGPQVFEQPRQVETETVVIFDSIESAPGSSVMLHSPELADHSSDGAIGLGGDAIEPSIRSEDDQADPTVLWVIDEDDDDDEDDGDEQRPEEETDELPSPI